MIEAFSDYNGLEMFFLISAILGSFFVVIKLLMQFVGADTDFDGADGLDGADGFDGEHVDSDVGFQILSIHGLSSFFMMFGFVGLAIYRQSQLGTTFSIIGAVIAGIIAVWVIGLLFKYAMKLQSSGTLQNQAAIGCTGKVYLTIRKGGSGQVSINFHNRLREFEATELNGNEVPTGTPIKVVSIKANLLVVEVLS